ncbi:FRG domain protein [Streptococcus oralis subsp. tigurinus]|nr:FRG domain protein [Streptococcus oralis subsp. tigurinus]
MTSNNQMFYDSLGSFFCGKSTEDTIKKLNSQIYNDTDITIKLGATNSIDNQNEDSKYGPFCYKIVSLYSKGADEEINSFVSELNTKLKKSGTNAGYNEKGNHWSIFYLLKELISKLEQCEYNFFRGQTESWPTIPALFRKKVNKDSKFYYELFEQLYKQVSQEYPDRVEYYSIDEDLDARADQLAKLQHYELPTSLLDITDSPFVALLFLSNSGNRIIKEPKFEAFKMSIEEHSKSSLLTFVRKGHDNQRIRAQHGAFINYDKLSKYTHFTKDEIKISDEFRRIPRVSITIEFSKKETEELLKNEEELISKVKEEEGYFFSKEDIEKVRKGEKTLDDIMGGTLSENLKPTQKYSKANIKAVKESLKAQDFKEKYYKVIQDELIRKLGEYGYFSHTLFPDFGDYLGYLSKNFVDVSDDKKDETKIDLSKLSDD